MNLKKKEKKIKKIFNKNQGNSIEENSNAIDYLIKKLFEKLQEEYGKITRSFLICAVGGYE